MKLARYWAKESGEALRPGGGRIQVKARGWSNQSFDDARKLGREIAMRLAEVLAAGQIERGRYLYGQRPLPEPILREFDNGPDRPLAAVTRNAYGALVLNTRDMMFADIDRHEGRPDAANLVSTVMSLFRKSAPAPQRAAAPTVTDIQRVADANRLSARIYKTAAGYRVIVANGPYEPGSARSEALLKQFDSDPLYIRLCKMQESFRARLSPKPWRCRLPVPPASFPFTTPQEESRFQDWERRYSAAAVNYATCRYLTTIGEAAIHHAFEPLIQFHDQETRANSSLPLA